MQQSIYPAIVQEIHKEFFTASDKILAEAVSILENGETNDIAKGKRLKKIGFVNTREAKLSTTKDAQINGTIEAAKVIEKFRVKYPLYKFITEDVVEQICKKYSLVKAPVKNYKGFVPLKNIQVVESFTVNKSDLPSDAIRIKKCWGLGLSSLLWFANPIRVHKMINMEVIPVDDPILRMSSNNCIEETPKGRIWIEEYDLINRSEMMICAPAKDFDLKGLKKNKYSFRSSTHIEVPDPVVLQPVKGGYLIVTAWGDEASDEIIVNQINN